MWLIFLVCAVFAVVFVTDWLEKKQQGEVLGWRYFGGILACLAIGLTLGGGFFFWQVRPNWDKQFPDWLGRTLVIGLPLFFWFAPTFALLWSDSESEVSPSQIVNGAVGEELIFFLGFMAIVVSGIVVFKFNWPMWTGLLFLLPVWIAIFYAWGASNWALAWILFRLRKIKH